MKHVKIEFDLDIYNFLTQPLEMLESMLKTAQATIKQKAPGDTKNLVIEVTDVKNEYKTENIL